MRDLWQILRLNKNQSDDESEDEFCEGEAEHQ
jgi:hypothetical protein